MSYTPTTWVNGTAPGISADELNRVETGIDSLWKQTRDIVVYTNSTTLALTDAGKIVEADKATAIAITVPPNATIAFPVGTQIELVAVGAGALTVVAGVGVTIRCARTLVFTTQWSGGTLYKRATNEWVLLGDLLD